MALSKDEFLKKMKQQYDELNYRWNVERSKLEAKTQHISAEARQKMEKEWEDLGQLRQRMKEKMIDLEVAGENAWDEFKDGAEDAWEDVRDGTEKAWKAFSEGLKKAAKRFK
jgi:flagellar hook-basal body complex protein FliE